MVSTSSLHSKLWYINQTCNERYLKIWLGRTKLIVVFVEYLHSFHDVTVAIFHEHERKQIINIVFFFTWNIDPSISVSKPALYVLYSCDLQCSPIARDACIVRVKLFKGKECQYWKWNWGSSFNWLIWSTKIPSYIGKNDNKHIFETRIWNYTDLRKI